MKKWTVMLIPHDRGSTRSLNLSAYQLWVVVGLFAVLSFTSTFLFERGRLAGHEMVRLRQDAERLERDQRMAVVPRKEGISERDLAKLEAQLRAEYEARDQAITSRLSELYDLEVQVRTMTGLTGKGAATLAAGALGGGQGGPSDAVSEMVFASGMAMAPPVHLIYGLSRPSADMIVEEIALRTHSLRNLLEQMEIQEDAIARVPSAWPTNYRNRRLTSQFGYRRDPFTRRLAQHSGTDIAVPVGTKVLATARGAVVFAESDGAYGNMVKIDHGNGIMTWYAHMKDFTVRVGDTVERGDTIGHCGTTGRTTGPHIHYEVRVNGKAVDAAAYLGK
jgi:murein DD-endopeptidase MepM/ murein hydrolase activator NlpD